ncbi:hypothetical protein PAPHI01_1091 [Pancytospora philotis]|nr:hypothetical protein PAPHI01_1091 [Pancytospora philotis]
MFRGTHLKMVFVLAATVTAVLQCVDEMWNGCEREKIIMKEVEDYRNFLGGEYQGPKNRMTRLNMLFEYEIKLRTEAYGEKSSTVEMTKQQWANAKKTLENDIEKKKKKNMNKKRQWEERWKNSQNANKSSD